ncbi:unnamed protein product [Lactuca virosa]|uniref:PRONE domain-containing protein n=1 Tax=Lactuca virosa TaxID=75947 RepID=A0AAU9MN69_9ASTR|nr:unnamed protein product [Lactuca virosa]
MLLLINNRDVGQEVMESYSRVIESLAFNLMARIDDMLYVDDSTKKHAAVEAGLHLQLPRFHGFSSSSSMVGRPTFDSSHCSRKSFTEICADGESGIQGNKGDI